METTSVRQLAQDVEISVGSVDNIHDHLNMQKLSDWWTSRLLTPFQMLEWVHCVFVCVYTVHSIISWNQCRLEWYQSSKSVHQLLLYPLNQGKKSRKSLAFHQAEGSRTIQPRPLYSKTQTQRHEIVTARLQLALCEWFSLDSRSSQAGRGWGPPHPLPAWLIPRLSVSTRLSWDSLCGASGIHVCYVFVFEITVVISMV